MDIEAVRRRGYMTLEESQDLGSLPAIVDMRTAAAIAGTNVMAIHRLKGKVPWIVQTGTRRISIRTAGLLEWLGLVPGREPGHQASAKRAEERQDVAPRIGDEAVAKEKEDGDTGRKAPAAKGVPDAGQFSVDLSDLLGKAGDRP